MNWKTNYFFLILVLLVIACSHEKGTEDLLNKKVLTSSELTKLIDHPDVAVIDLRSQDEYEHSHIPGAVHITREDIQQDGLPYAGKIAPKEKIEKLLGEKGIKPTDLIVAYDNNSMCEAARLWWVLQYYGHTKFAILSGGYDGWPTSLTSESKDTPVQTAYTFSEERLPALVIDADELYQTLGRQVNVLDVRSIAEHEGDYIKNGAFKAGHIPTSVNLDWLEFVDHEKQEFLPAIEIEKKLAKLGFSRDSDIVVYCHSGVRSAHTTFVLTQLLGYENVRNYDGSWVEWSYSDLPIIEKKIN